MTRDHADVNQKRLQTKVLMSSDFAWDELNQVRCGVVVSRVIKLLRENPKPIEEMSLADWSIETDGNRHAVSHENGIRNGIHQHKIPPDTANTFPILIGVGNGRKFIIDGAHRAAKYLLARRRTIPAVVLTEDETRACVRDGQMERFDRETKR